MNAEDINFPVYRKYKNNKSYFKITGPRHFQQIQVFGNKMRISETEARIFPEVSFVRDLLFQYESMASEISAAEYETVYALAVEGQRLL